MLVENKGITVSGKFIKIARLKEEWDEGVEDPVVFVKNLKSSGIKADIFTFMQRLPESKPKYNFAMEWDSVAAIPITTYDHWFNKQLQANPRNKIRKAQKKGVVIKRCDFNDKLVKNLMEMCHETPIRQGKPNLEYNIDFETLKKANATFLDRAIFFGAYFNDELIGFLKLVATDNFTRTMGILGMVARRDKAPMNLLIAKAVEICAEKKRSYFVYGKYNYGRLGSDTLQDFKRYHGFENIVLPRYYIPLNIWGKIILKLNLHHSLVELLPKRIIRYLLHERSKWYTRKYST